MKVHIKYYAKYRDLTGRREEDMDVDGMTVRELLTLLRERYPQIKNDSASLIALNNEFRSDETMISEGDIISVFPPVSGG